MTRPKTNVPRTLMKVPVTFRDDVMKDAHAAGMDATVYLEDKQVVKKVMEDKQ